MSFNAERVTEAVAECDNFADPCTCPKCGCAKFYIHETRTIAKVEKQGIDVFAERIDDCDEVYDIMCAASECDWEAELVY